MIIKKLMHTTLVLLIMGAVFGAPSYATESNFSKFFRKIKEIINNKRSKSPLVYDAKYIPEDVLLQILPHLGAQDLVRLSGVSHNLQAMAKVELAKAKLAFLVGDVKKIEKGTFIMGPAPGGEESPWGEERRSFKEITKDYWMMVHPVTQAQYEAVMGKDKIGLLKLLDNYKGAKRPVARLTRTQEDEYIGELNRQIKQLWTVIYPQSEKTGETEKMIPQFGKPTEEQWEYATTEPLIEPATEILDGRTVQITAKHMMYSGTNTEADLGNFADFRRGGDAGPLAVDVKEPNLRGIRGMSGGVWEVTSTHYENSSGFVLRGGGWVYNARSCRSAVRRNFSVADSYEDVGFRLVSL